jgi:hypothetical protein
VEVSLMDEAQVERLGSGLLDRATSPTILAPLQLPVIEQVFNDIYDQRYPMGVLSQVRWLQGKARKRRWRSLVDDAFERMGIAILNEMVNLTAYQAGRAQRELAHAEGLRFETERLRVIGAASLEVHIASTDYTTSVQRAQMLLQAQIDQAAERLRQTHDVTIQQGQQRHELAMANQLLLNQITLRVNAVQRTTEGLAAMRQVWDEMSAINQLFDEDEKHRRLTMLQQALPFLLRFDG